MISLIGNDPETVEVGTSYTDAGATSNDNYDGTGSVVASGSVDTNTVGIYTLTYDQTDTSGNVAIQVSRTVKVIDS